MQADLGVFANAVVEGGRFPGVGEEDHADCLAEVVELEAGAADSGHDGGVGDDVGLDAELAGAEDEVGVCCCAGYVNGSVSGCVFWFVFVVVYPNGSPTTRKAMSVLSAPARISSLPLSTSSRSASITGRP